MANGFISPEHERKRDAPKEILAPPMAPNSTKRLYQNYHNVEVTLQYGSRTILRQPRADHLGEGGGCFALAPMTNNTTLAPGRFDL